MANNIKYTEKGFSIGVDKVNFRYSEKHHNTVYNMYKSNEYIYAGVNVKAENLASIEYYGDGAYAKIVAKPNDVSTFYELIYDISKSVDLYGYAFVGTAGRSIYFLDASDVQTNNKVDDVYVYAGGVYKNKDFDRIIKIDVDDSAVQALYSSAELFELVKLWNLKNIKNGGFSGRLITPKNAIDDDRLLALRDMMAEVMSGVDNQNRSVVFSDELTVSDLFKASEMDYSKLIDVCRDNILSALRVPKELVGIMNDSNRASSNTAVVSFIDNVIVPRATMICAKLSNIGLGALKFIKPNNQTAQDKLNEAVGLYTSGIITQNEARALFGYDEIAVATSTPKRYKKDLLDIKRQHLDLYDSANKDILTRVRAFFKLKKERVLSRLGSKASDADIDYILGDETISPVLLDMYSKYAKRAVQQAITDGIEYDYLDIEVWARETATSISDKIDKTTRDEVSSAINKSDLEGTSRVLAVSAVLDSAIKYRSVAIATSEATRIINGAKNEVYTSVGRGVGSDKIEKVWIAIHDNRVRHTHLGADGQVSRDGKFNVGGEILEYPGDPSGSAGNTINCRCTITANL